MRQCFYTHIDVFLLCFSLVDPESLENIINIWINEIQEYCTGKPIILVGLKSDLRDEFESETDKPKDEHMKPVTRESGE